MVSTPLSSALVSCSYEEHSRGGVLSEPLWEVLKETLKSERDRKKVEKRAERRLPSQKEKTEARTLRMACCDWPSPYRKVGRIRRVLQGSKDNSRRLPI